MFTLLAHDLGTAVIALDGHAARGAALDLHTRRALDGQPVVVKRINITKLLRINITDIWQSLKMIIVRLYL